MLWWLLETKSVTWKTQFGGWWPLAAFKPRALDGECPKNLLVLSREWLPDPSEHCCNNHSLPPFHAISTRKKTDHGMPWTKDFEHFWAKATWLTIRSFGSLKQFNYVSLHGLQSGWFQHDESWRPWNAAIGCRQHLKASRLPSCMGFSFPSRDTVEIASGKITLYELPEKDISY